MDIVGVRDIQMLKLAPYNVLSVNPSQHDSATVFQEECSLLDRDLKLLPQTHEKIIYSRMETKDEGDTVSVTGTYSRVQPRILTINSYAPVFRGVAEK